MIMQLDPKGNHSRSSIYISKSFSSIDLKYINKHVIYSNIQKLLPKQQMQKSKLALPKKMRRKFFGLLQMLTWLQKSFKKHEYYHKKHTSVPSKSDFSTSNGRFYSRFKFSHRHYWATSYYWTLLRTSLLLVIEMYLWSEK